MCWLLICSELIFICFAENDNHDSCCTPIVDGWLKYGKCIARWSAQTFALRGHLRSVATNNDETQGLRSKIKNHGDSHLLSTESLKTVASFEDLEAQVKNCGCACYANETAVCVDPTKNVTFFSTVSINPSCENVIMTGNVTELNETFVLPILVTANGAIQSAVSPTATAFLIVENLHFVGFAIAQASLWSNA